MALEPLEAGADALGLDELLELPPHPARTIGTASSAGSRYLGMIFTGASSWFSVAVTCNRQDARERVSFPGLAGAFGAPVPESDASRQPPESSPNAPKRTAQKGTWRVKAAIRAPTPAHGPAPGPLPPQGR